MCDLVYTAWDLQSFARDLRYDGPPFRWEPGRRGQIRAELDVAFFHLHGLAREEVEYVMDRFRIVERRHEQGRGEYLTEYFILGRYEAMTLGGAFFPESEPIPDVGALRSSLFGCDRRP